MKIVALKGSPRTNGNTDLLTRQFIKGAIESGHEVFEFDCARHHVNGCLGCDRCGMSAPCVQKDDFGILRDRLIEADVILFATPIYYFGMTAQLKNVIDRFYSIHDIMGPKRTLLFATMGNPDPRVADPIVDMYKKMVHYLHWKDCGKIIANGIWAKGSILGTSHMHTAYRLGKELR